MKLLLALLMLSFITTKSYSQILKITDSIPVTINCIEYGYILKNEQQKSIKSDAFARFEVTLYATNKCTCTKLYVDRPSTGFGESPNLLARFDITNANGKRLTSKNGKLTVLDFNVPVKVLENGVEVNRTVKAGYILRSNETIRTNIIVLVPIGEKPTITVQPNYIPEM